MNSSKPWAKPRAKTLVLSGRLVMVVILSVLLALFLTHTLWLPAMGRFLVVADPLAPGDAVLVLAGDERRAFYAAELYEQGYARKLLITGLPLETPRERAVYIRRIKTIALQQGVPEEAIVLVPEIGRTTYEEALNVRRFVEEQNLASLLVVTSEWHTRRTKMIFSKVFQGAETTVSIHPLSKTAYRYWGPPYTPEAWWRDSTERNLTLSEYLKMVAYFLGVR